MPQLDISAYTTNFFWFVIVFSFFYIFILKIILPRLSAIFVFRLKLNESTVNDAYKFRLVLDYFNGGFQYFEAYFLYSLCNSFLDLSEQSINFQKVYNFANLVSYGEVEAFQELELSY